jgi:hypothetical protein
MSKVVVKRKGASVIIDRDEVMKNFSNEQKNRTDKGKRFENKIDDMLVKHQLVCEKHKATVSVIEDGVLRKIVPDHFYQGAFGKFWIEDTIILDETHADRLNQKKKRVEQSGKKGKMNYVIFFDKNTDQKSRKNVDRYITILKGKGWIVCDGMQEIKEYIETLSMIEGKHKNGKIQAAKSIMIPVDKIKFHESNRNLDHERCRDLAKKIIKNGFTSQINVVPEYKNGKPTGYFIAYDGNHRLYAVQEFVIKLYGQIIDQLPCILVDWINSEMPVELHNLLIEHNTNSKKWGMPDYVDSHLKESKKHRQKIKAYSFSKLKWLYDVTAENHPDNVTGIKYNKTKFYYHCGPVNFDSDKVGKNNDQDVVKEGTYRLSQKEFDTMMKPFVQEVAMPFVAWWDENRSKYTSGICNVFLKYLYNYMKSDPKKYSLNRVKGIAEEFKKLGTDKMPTKVDDKQWRALWKNFGITLGKNFQPV